MSSYSIDAEKFINEIRKHRELWDLDVNRKPYRIKVKERAWSNVATVFIQDFDSMTKLEKAEVYRKLYNKWRNIRDAYVRNIRGTRHQSEYIFMKQLSFLNNRYNPGHKTEGKSSDDEEDKNENETANDSADSDEEAPSVIENLKRRRVSRKRQKIEVVTTQNSEFNDPMYIPQDAEKHRSNRTMIEVVDTPLQSLEFDTSMSMSRVNEESSNDLISRSFDEDRSFFDSLLPAVRQFDMDQKLKFRYEVLRIIKDIRLSVQNNCKPEPSSAYYLE